MPLLPPTCCGGGDGGGSGRRPAAGGRRWVFCSVCSSRLAAAGGAQVEFPADSPISHVECSGYVSNANFHIKRGNFIFFINNRLVESSDLKRAVQESYSAVLPKGGHPFVFLRLRLPPQDIDVNVHPVLPPQRHCPRPSLCSEVRLTLSIG